MTNTIRNQHTISQPCEVRGFGFWSGRDVHVEFRPAAENTGIVFVRHDLPAPVRIAASVWHRIEVPRRTNLAVGGVSVEMVEHIMAAFAGLQIDNCEVWMDAAEAPGCDGSSQPFVDALLTAGVVEQQAPRRQLRIDRITRVGDADCWVEARPASHNRMLLSVEIDYGHHAAIGRQALETVVTPNVFRNDLAAARTFILEEEAAWLRQQGLGQRVSPSDLLVFNNHGVVGNELRFVDECVRHKTLDLIGDLALAGCDLIGHIVAHFSGHRLNAELVRSVLAHHQAETSLRMTA